MQSQDIKDLAVALSKVQGEISGAVKDSSNPFFKSRYADLESVWDACRASLSKHGLCVIQTLDGDERCDYLITTLAHASGQWVSSKLRLSQIKEDAQAMGSAITYARRYALAAIVGVVQVDDDAEGAMGRSNNRAPEIKNVMDVRRSVAAQDDKQPSPESGDSSICSKCGKKSMISKMNDAQFYCVTCKVSRPRVA